MIQNDILQIEFLNNTIQDYLFFFLFFALFLIFLSFLKIYLLKILTKAKFDFASNLREIIKKIKLSFYIFISFYFSLKWLSVGSFIEDAMDGILIALIVYYIIIALQVFIDYLFYKYFTKEKDKTTEIALLNIAKILKALLWIFGILVVVSNFGVNVTSLVAGLGIGGLAIAIALQNILSDLFSSFAIFFDKPFIVGDFIIVGDNMGIVDRIGIKTTRIKSLQGEEIIISNRELTSVRIQNFKKMQERRIVFNFGVVYKTSINTLKEIPKIIEEIIKNENLVRFDRAHFFKFDSSSLSFEVVYYVLSGDYNSYMNVHQSILFKMKEAFDKRGISMAFPTQTIYLEK